MDVSQLNYYMMFFSNWCPLGSIISIGIYITFYILNTMSCKSILPPLLLERVGERRIKSTSYIPLIPAFSLKGEGAGTCVDTYAPPERVNSAYI